jgi:ketosteroid isomerase-like protein
MKKFVVAVLAVAAVVFTGVGRGQGKTDPALNKLAAEFAAAFNGQDAAKVAAFYTEDAVVMSANRPMIKGRPNIEADLKRDFKDGVANLQLKPMESSVMGDFAFEAGTSTVTVKGKPVPGKYLTLFRRVGKDWKIVYDSFGPDQPPPPGTK